MPSDWKSYHWVQRGIIELIPLLLALQVMLQTTATYLDLYGIAGAYDCVDRDVDCKRYIAGGDDAYRALTAAEVQARCNANDYFKDMCKLSCGCPGCDSEGRNCKAQSDEYLTNGYEQIFKLEGRRRQDDSWEHNTYGYSLYGHDTKPTAVIILCATFAIMLFCIGVQAFFMYRFKKNTKEDELVDFDLALCFALNNAYRGWFTFIAKLVIIVFVVVVWIYLCRQEEDMWIPIEGTYIQIALVCYSIWKSWKPTDVDAGDYACAERFLNLNDKPKKGGCFDGLMSVGGWLWCGADRSQARVMTASMEALYKDSSAQCEMQKMEKYHKQWTDEA